MPTRPNIDEYQPHQPVDTLVHLGVGRCSELDAYLAKQPKRMLLVEADPQLAEAVQARTASLPQVQVHCATVAGSPGPATFFRYNLPDAGSLHPASGLLQLFPGLKTVEEIQVDAVSPAALLQPLQLQQVQENLLIIDLPGEELPVLQGLQQAQQLHLFRQLHLYCGRQPLYESSLPARQILQWLQDQGFDLLSEDDSKDPDRPLWILQRNTLQLHNRELQTQIEQLAEEKEEVAKLAAERQSKIESLVKDRDALAKQSVEHQQQVEQLSHARDEQVKLAAEQQSQIQQLTQARDGQAKESAGHQQRIEQLAKEKEEVARLAAERQTKIESLIKDRDAQVKQSVEHQQQIEQLTHARDEQVKLAAEQQSQIQQLTQARDEQVKVVGEKQAQIQKLTQARDEQAQQLGTLYKDLRDARQTMSLTIKLQTLREVDLKDLQARYKVSLTAQEEQHRLLAKLGERLSAVSNYFHQITDNGATPYSRQIANKGTVPLSDNKKKLKLTEERTPPLRDKRNGKKKKKKKKGKGA